MTTIKYKRYGDTHFENLDRGETFLHNGTLGIVVESCCDNCGGYYLRAIEMETGTDMELSPSDDVRKVDIEITVL